MDVTIAVSRQKALLIEFLLDQEAKRLQENMKTATRGERSAMAEDLATAVATLEEVKAAGRVTW